MNSRKKERLGSKRKGNNKSKRAKGMSRCCNNKKICTIIYHIVRRRGRILGGKEADDDRPYMVAVMMNLDGDEEYVEYDSSEYVEYDGSEYYDDVGGGKARSKQAGKRSDKPKEKKQGK